MSLSFESLPELKATLEESEARLSALKVVSNLEDQTKRLEALELELAQEDTWQDSERMLELNREKSALNRALEPLLLAEKELRSLLEDMELLELEFSESLLSDLNASLKAHRKELDRLEFRQRFQREEDALPAFLEIQAGSGGTEAQDWAEMLLRMYQRFLESSGFEYEILERSTGEVAGIRSATLKVSTPYAYGTLRTETGVHRLVRKSPFDSGNRRHTSFASVFVSPEIDDSIDIEINPADLKVDTYRSSGAGGQHVNKTDSAVRITHTPTGLVVQCQTERSQHQNRDRAMKQLRSKLYQLELDKRRAKAEAVEAAKDDISWGNQIRSYVLDQSRIKDLRTNHETSDTKSVLDGDLMPFIEASLKAGL